MSVIIATWDVADGQATDAYIVVDMLGDTINFTSIDDASEWIDDNDRLVCTYTKIIEL